MTPVEFFQPAALEKAGIGHVRQLPYSLKICSRSAANAKSGS